MSAAAATPVERRGTSSCSRDITTQQASAQILTAHLERNLVFFFGGPVAIKDAIRFPPFFSPCESGYLFRDYLFAGLISSCKRESLFADRCQGRGRRERDKEGGFALLFSAPPPLGIAKREKKGKKKKNNASSSSSSSSFSSSSSSSSSFFSAAESIGLPPPPSFCALSTSKTRNHHHHLSGKTTHVCFGATSR